jgi:RNA polymerase sigma-70 factor (ECF subfamily)
MADETSFVQLLARVKAGDQDAAAQIFERYSGRLRALARSRLGRRVLAKVDPEDIVQSVCRSFFVRHAKGQFEFDGWNGLWALLATITLRKCGQKVNYFQAIRRDVRREQPATPSPDDSAASWQAIAREPTPSEAAILVETVQEMMRGLEGHQRDVFELALQGYSVAEISDKVGYSRRTVQRVVERVRRRLEHLLPGDAQPSIST